MLATFPPSYLYQQYRDDPHLRALVAVQNEYQQAILDQLNALNLPVYTGGLVAGELLDWVLQGVYGVFRPTFGFVNTAEAGSPYNTDPYDSVVYNGDSFTATFSFQVATDDQYRRVATWNLYKGDGYQFGGRWLKRRVARFLIGPNGTDPGIDQTYLIGVVFGADNEITINCDSSLLGIDVLTQAVAGGFLLLPFEYTYTVQAV